MTTRLYYLEPYRTAFDAVVTSCETHDGRLHVALDRTVFYPTSGGQPFDTGVLGDARVLDVIDREDDVVVHVVDRPLNVGSTVTGTIDWDRRFDHMQQHTGQHVLSAAFDRLFDVRTESFHLGTAAATVDLAREVTASEVAAAESESNRVVWEDRPVSIRFASPEEAMALPLRKEPARGGRLRLIEIDDFDLSACGGTHVARTGAIGTIAITGTEKFRGGSRVEFLCGGRVLSRFRLWREAFAATRQHLSVGPAELAGAVERLQGDAKSLQRTIRSLQEQLASHEAKGLLARGERLDDRLIVAEALDGWDAAGLKALAVAATSSDPRATAALFTTATPQLAVVARGKECSVDAAAVLKALFARFGGKGGGKPDLAQGGGLTAKKEDLVAAAMDLLRR
ncbi:MAG TPA: DHHA1 domain-containing protein [Vicinamibacterales bacterium]|nr:DHHA1 domain-containing protein [Vicinamibacterales bacterium]